MLEGPKKRSQSKRVAFGSLLTFYIINVYINLRNESWYEISTSVCERDDLGELRIAALSVKAALDELDITYFLAFGTLFGAMRYKDILPWDSDVDLIIVPPFDHDQLIARLKEKTNATANDYGVWYGPKFGYYKVRGPRVDDKIGVQVDLLVYKEWWFNGYMHRVGWDAWWMWYRNINTMTFPARLVKGTLPTMEFIGVQWPVPKEGIEIQKYHYANNWWKESKPLGC